MATFKLGIPKEEEEVVALLLTIAQENGEALVEALRDTPVSASRHDLCQRVSTAVGIEEPNADKLLHLLELLYNLRAYTKASRSSFVSSVREGAEAADHEKLKTAAKSEWKIFEKVLLDLLSLENSIGFRSKISEVMTSHGRLYCTSRIFTDIRPVFGTDPSSPPGMCVIIHTLQLDYHEGTSDHREFFVALDNRDVKELKRALNRAEKKEESLKNLLAKSEVPVLDLTNSAKSKRRK